MKQSLKYNVIYHSAERPRVEVLTSEVKEGVHAIIIDFSERFSLNAYGGGENDDGTNVESIYFGKNEDDGDILFEIEFIAPVGMIIGTPSKRSYQGTYYSQEAWSNLWGEL